jgi:methylmalonyl-CoA/ethylmalonyl-CoA epimerase
VADMEQAVKTYEQLLQTPCYKKEQVASEGVETAFFQLADSKIELLEAMNEDSPIAKFILKKGEGIHHIAFEVEDIEAEMKRLSALGFQVLNEQPKRGADNKLVCFLHPKSAHGVLVELCQEIK